MPYKVSFDPKTTLVTGYYDLSLNYNNIPENIIVITDEQYKNIEDINNMCIINGVLQVFIKSNLAILQESIAQKLLLLKSYYYSDATWTISVVQDKNSLNSKTCDWWQSICNSIVSANITASFSLYAPNGNPFKVDVTPVIAQKILISQLQIRQSLSDVYQQCITDINKFDNILDIENYDYNANFKKINKIITL